MNRLIKYSLLVIVILTTSFTLSAQLKGKAIKISDGDTFTLLTKEKEQIKIRLNGVDCPEKNQAFGNRAKQFTSDLIFEKKLRS